MVSRELLDAYRAAMRHRQSHCSTRSIILTHCFMSRRLTGRAAGPAGHTRPARSPADGACVAIASPPQRSLRAVSTAASKNAAGLSWPSGAALLTGMSNAPRIAPHRISAPHRRHMAAAAAAGSGGGKKITQNQFTEKAWQVSARHCCIGHDVGPSWHWVGSCCVRLHLRSHC